MLGREHPGERGDVGGGREIEPAEARAPAQQLESDRTITGVPGREVDPALGLLGPLVQVHAPERVLGAGQRDRLLGLARQVVLLDREAEVRIGLAPDRGIGPVVALIGCGDEGEPAVVVHGALQHLDRVVVVLEADAVAVVAGGGDLEQQRLAPGAGRGLEHIDHVAGPVGVQLVDDRAVHVQAIHRAGVGRQRHEARGAGGDMQIVDQDADPALRAPARSRPCAWPHRTRCAPDRGWLPPSRPRRRARRRRPTGKDRCRPTACSCRSSVARRNTRCGSGGDRPSAASRTGSRPRTPARARARRSARPTRPWSGAESRRSRSRGALPRYRTGARGLWPRTDPRDDARRRDGRRRLASTRPSATARA